MDKSLIKNFINGQNGTFKPQQSEGFADNAALNAMGSNSETIFQMQEKGNATSRGVASFADIELKSRKSYDNGSIDTEDRKEPMEFIAAHLDGNKDKITFGEKAALNIFYDQNKDKIITPEEKEQALFNYNQNPQKGFGQMQDIYQKYFAKMDAQGAPKHTYTVDKGDTLSKTLTKLISQIMPNLGNNEKKYLVNDLGEKLETQGEVKDKNSLAIGQKINISETIDNIFKYKNGSYITEDAKTSTSATINKLTGLHTTKKETPSTYTVKKGENLTQIAHKFGMSVQEICELNGIKNANQLEVGQSLKLGKAVNMEKVQKREELIAELAQQPEAKEEKSDFYVVKKGDSLSKISKNLGMSVKDICDLNGIKDPNNLDVGQVLRIHESKNTLARNTLKRIAHQEPTARVEYNNSPTITYNVVSGDNPTVIAKKFRQTTGSLASTKDITKAIADKNKGIDFKKLQIGQKITIPTEIPFTDSIYQNHVKTSQGLKANLTKSQENDLEKFLEHYKANSQRYEKIAEITGYPAELIAALHFREASGDFSRYLHNGEKVGTVSRVEPVGVKFNNWEESALDVLNNKYYKNYKQIYRLSSSCDDIIAMSSFAERYNGSYYKNQGINSPYIYSGTNQYSQGKFVKDGKYSSQAVDKQLGVYIMLKALEIQKQDENVSNTEICQLLKNNPIG